MVALASSLNQPMRHANQLEVPMSPMTCRVLVADDSEDERFLIQHFLRFVPDIRLIGWVRDGEETLARLRGEGSFGDRARFPYPDLLLLDYEMPGMNGMEVLALLEEETIRPRIVLWSNALELVDQELAREFGADLVCQKPADSLEMMTVMNRAGWRTLATLPPICAPRRASLIANRPATMGRL